RPGRRADPELIERRRTQILCAAAGLFARAGYPDADLQEVADALGVAKGTLYRYFPSKEALFLAVVDQGMRRVHEFVRAAYQDIADPLDRIETAIRAYLQFYQDHPDQVELLVLERAAFRDRKEPTYFAHKRQHSQEWRDVFAGLIAAGRVRDVP